MIRPLSLGTVYSNGPETFPYPYVLFGMGRKVGAVTGYAHFDGSQKHSSLPMDLALKNLDFIEVFQFGRLRSEDWYALLNAGFQVTGVAGSDFPVSVNNFTREAKWSRWIPLLGPERMLVKAKAGASAYEAWAAGLKKGEGVVTNGPLLDLEVKDGRATAKAKFWRALQGVEIVVNGKVAGSGSGGTETSATATLPESGAVWVAARTSAAADPVGTPEIQAHTNPVYVRWDGSAPDTKARAALAERWEREVAYYRTAELVFPSEGEKNRFFELCERSLRVLRGGRE
jgi:hypothetical protein